MTNGLYNHPNTKPFRQMDEDTYNIIGAVYMYLVVVILIAAISTVQW